MEKISYSVLTFLLNALWQVAVVYLVAAFFARLMRNTPARYIHFVWVLALLLSFGLPLWSLSSFGDGTTVSTPAPLVEAEAVNQKTTLVPEAWMKARAVHLPSFISKQSASVLYTPFLAFALMGCYSLLLLRRIRALWQGWVSTKEIRRAAIIREPSPLMTASAEQCWAAFGIKNFPVFCSSQTPTPLTIGVRRPIIVLPESLFEETSADVLCSALGHEMAHIRRRDFLLNLVYTLLCLPISFHPCAVLIKRRIDETRELACDEMVVTTGRLVKAAAYARSLIHLAGSTPVINHPGYSLGVFDANILEERIMKLIHQRRRTGAHLGKLFVFIASFCLAATSFAAAAFSFRAAPPIGSGEKTIVGMWHGKFPKCVDAACPPAIDLTVKMDEGKLSGLAVFYIGVNDGGGLKVKGKVEAPLIDPQFDGTTLSFKSKRHDEAIVALEMKLVRENEGELRNLSEEPSATIRMLRMEKGVATSPASLSPASFSSSKAQDKRASN